MIDYPFNAAISAIKAGLSANEGLRQLRAAGGAVRRETWLGMIREARTALQSQALGVDRPGNRRPAASEILPWSRPNATGYQQYVDVWVRNRETGEIYPRPFRFAC